MNYIKTFYLCVLLFSFNYAQAALNPTELYEDITSLAHGAIPNDGIDDSDAIISAIEAAKVNSKKVLIPVGTFIVNKEISFSGNEYMRLQIEGVSWDSIIEHTGGDYAFHVGNGQNITDYVVFRNFSIRAVSHSGSPSSGIYFERAHRALVDHMQITSYLSPTAGENQEGAAAIKYNNTWIHTVRDSNLSHTYIGVTTVGGSVNALNIESNIIEGSIKYAISLESVNNVNIVNNTIEGEGLEQGIYMSSACRNINILNNYFEGNQSSVIYVSNNAENRVINITGNRFFPYNTDYYLEIVNARSVTIRSNEFVGNPNVNGAYIRISRGTATPFVEISGNYANPQNPVLIGRPSLDWKVNGGDVNFVRLLNLNGTSGTQNLMYGFIYDIENKKFIYGSSQNFVQSPN
jgi:Right handed beta helix region